jgi:hypothetical protein
MVMATSQPNHSNGNHDLNQREHGRGANFVKAKPITIRDATWLSGLQKETPFARRPPAY